MHRVIVALLTFTVACGSTSGAKAPKPAVQDLAPDEQVFRPGWKAGDVFVVQLARSQTEHGKAPVTGRCKYNLEIEDHPQGILIRQTGLLPGAPAKGLSELQFHNYYGLWNCLLHGVVLTDKYEYVGYEPVPFLGEIHEAVRQYYSDPRFEPGMADLVNGVRLSEDAIERQTIDLLNLMLYAMGKTPRQLDGRTVKCQYGDCFKAAFDLQQDPRVLEDALKVNVVRGGQSIEYEIVTTVNPMYPELITVNTKIDATIDDGQRFELKGSGKTEYRFKKVPVAPKGVYENPNKPSESLRAEFATAIPESVQRCCDEISEPGSHRVRVEIDSLGRLIKVSSLRGHKSLAACVEQELKSQTFPKVDSSVLMILMFVRDAENRDAVIVE